MKKVFLNLFTLFISTHFINSTTCVAALSPVEKKEIQELLEIKLPKSYIKVLKGERKIADLLEGSELSNEEKRELKSFINSNVPRQILPLVRGDKNLDQLGLREYYLEAKEEAQNIKSEEELPSVSSESSEKAIENGQETVQVSN